MKKFWVVIMLAAFVLSGAGQAAEPAKKIKVLLLTGSDVKSHDWTKTSPQLKKILEDTGRFDVTVVNMVENQSVLENADGLKAYDVIVQNCYYLPDKPPLSDKAKDNLLSFVRDGKGFVCFHLSSASWQDWDEWHKMVGRWWNTVLPKEERSGHGPRGKFQVKIANPKHPITRGIQDFEADDELYAKLSGTEPIEVLVTADSEWSKKTEPLAFIKTYGKGRVYHFCFGHDVPALENPSVMRLFARGTEWAATGDVAPSGKGKGTGKGGKKAKEAQAK
ncbi:MAG: ThuA domain-containing protein [Candidatus Sumerlaeia bacterium]|nr:ThuA domain-containing protein [Candidatus Sumerlaeia bacterium]